MGSCAHGVGRRELCGPGWGITVGMRRQCIVSSRLSTVASRSVWVLTVDVVVVHRLPFSIPFNGSDMPVALIKVVIGEQSAVVSTRSINPKSIQGIAIEGGVGSAASLVW